MTKLKENEELFKQTEAIEAAQVEELSRLREEKEKLEGELRSCHKRVETLANDNTILTSKVTTLESRARAAEEQLKEVEFERDAKIEKAANEAIAKFKQSEEFAALLEVERDAGRDAGYDEGIEEIFFNIWVKCQNVDYRFLGGKLLKLIEGWFEEERLGTLDTAPPPSPPYPMVEGNVIATEVTPAEGPEQPPSTNAEDEAVTSNPPPTAEEPTNEVTSRFMGNHALINLEDEEELVANVDNDPPSAKSLYCFLLLIVLYGL